MTTITEMEKNVLTALFESSKGNGHDFGLVQECRKAVEQPKQLAGIMSSLSKKGLLTIHGDHTTDSGTWTQTTWNVDVAEIEALIGGGVKAPARKAKVRYRDWTKPTYTTLAPSVKRRIAVEQKIARFTVKHLIDAGFTLSVFDGEEVTIKRSTDPVAICNAMNTTDEDYLYVHRADEKERFGWLYFVYGNDGYDVISDYTTNLDPQMEAINKYSESFG